MAGGAVIAHKKGMSVAYMNVSVVKRGRYRLTFTPICEDASTMEPLQIMKQYYALLQKDIEAQPWNYLWTHKRWK
jgi:KDO2-lipid IV(A) lauroyltransferase